MNLLAVTGICLNVVIMLAIYFIQGGASGDTSISQLVGIMSGAVTNTHRSRSRTADIFAGECGRI